MERASFSLSISVLRKWGLRSVQSVAEEAGKGSLSPSPFSYFENGEGWGKASFLNRKAIHLEKVTKKEPPFFPAVLILLIMSILLTVFSSLIPS